LLSYRFSRRRGTATLAALFASGGAILSTPRPAFAYNCVNVVLRDPFWGQYRRVIESGYNASGIPGSLARAGFTVNGTPSVGAVMSWPAGTYGASGTGHVAIVTAIPGNGTVVVRHENWPYGAGEHLQTFPLRPGYQFVHQPSALKAGADDEDSAVDVAEDA
jgi:hypothetical protein